MNPPSPEFLAKAPEVIRKIQARIEDTHRDSIYIGGIYEQVYYGSNCPGLSELRRDMWAKTTELFGSGPVNTKDVFLAIYLLVLAEVCNLDLDQVLEDGKNAAPDRGV